MEQHPIPIRKPVSNKQVSLISSTRKIQKKKKSKKKATHTQVCSADLFFQRVTRDGFDSLV